ncbi:MAG: polyprenyl synthetase family protein [Spirochaetia bacterium]|nr:polyprenyl synthetase family protein [Spirochaetia bacterium]
MIAFWSDEEQLQEQLQHVSDTILSVVQTSHGFIRPILTDHVQGMGKMLRPAFVLITSELGPHDRTEEAIRVAAVIELIHLASLVHDDIIDSAPKRRGKATIYSRIGAKQAVLAGDYLLAKAMLLATGKERGINSSVVSNALSRLCESELDQDAGQGNFFISEHTYFRRIAGKTASLFSLSCYAGVALQEADPILTMRCHRIGYLMGMAFQIQDDILDYIGSSDTLGKPIAADLLSGVSTIPLLYALQEEKRLGGKELSSILAEGNLNKRTIKKVISLVQGLKGIQKAENLAQSYKNRALRDIKTLNHPKVERQLTNLIEKLSSRST